LRGESAPQKGSRKKMLPEISPPAPVPPSTRFAPINEKGEGRLIFNPRRNMETRGSGGSVAAAGEKPQPGAAPDLGCCAYAPLIVLRSLSQVPSKPLSPSPQRSERSPAPQPPQLFRTAVQLPLRHSRPGRRVRCQGHRPKLWQCPHAERALRGFRGPRLCGLLRPLHPVLLYEFNQCDSERGVTKRCWQALPPCPNPSHSRLLAPCSPPLSDVGRVYSTNLHK